MLAPVGAIALGVVAFSGRGRRLTSALVMGAAMFVTGSLQVLGTPMKAYYSDQFWLKMQLLVVAIIFTLAVRWIAVRRDEAPGWLKPAGLVSIVLWSFIAVQGRLIGLLQ